MPSRDHPSEPVASGPSGDRWCALGTDPLPVAEVHRFLGRPDCGAVVVFCGTARDHSPGRDGVHTLTYEAYEEVAVPRLHAVADELVARWPAVRRVALLHRTGEVPLGEEAVVVGVSSPHRADAFDAARFGIDAVKASVPIWKRERWDGGESWGLEAQHLVDPSEVDAAAAAAPMGGTAPVGERR